MQLHVLVCISVFESLKYLIWKCRHSVGSDCRDTLTVYVGVVCVGVVIEVGEV